jgi:hypothetical protein
MGYNCWKVLWDVGGHVDVLIESDYGLEIWRTVIVINVWSLVDCRLCCSQFGFQKVTDWGRKTSYKKFTFLAKL